MANEPLTIGVTGGIGSGKSTICKVFQSMGVPVYDADSRAKWLMNFDFELQESIQKVFGADSYSNRILNREYLAKLVFPHPEKVVMLNRLVHPAVGKDFVGWVQEHSNHVYLLKEAAILIESGANEQLDRLLLVTAQEDIRIKRVLKRDVQRSPDDVRNMMKRQMPEEEKKKYCHYILQNDGIAPILSELLHLHQEFLRLGYEKKNHQTQEK